jgi:phage terminase small subunit
MLTQKQLLFALESLVEGNATEAAKRAGYSRKTALLIALGGI